MLIESIFYLKNLLKLVNDQIKDNGGSASTEISSTDVERSTLLSIKVDLKQITNGIENMK